MSEGSARILVIEDDLAFVRIQEFNFGQAGFEVATARDGLEALDLVQQQQFDLIVTDHQMPRMSGIAFCQKIRALPNYSAVPIILCTAKVFEFDATEFESSLSPLRVLKKPASMTSLLETTRKLLSRD